MYFSPTHCQSLPLWTWCDVVLWLKFLSKNACRRSTKIYQSKAPVLWIFLGYQREQQWILRKIPKSYGPISRSRADFQPHCPVCPHGSRGCHCTELHLLVASAISHPWSSALLATPPASPHLYSYLRMFSFSVQSSRNQGLKGFCGSCLAPPLTHRNSAIPKFVHEEGEEGAERLSGSKLLLAWLWLAPSTGVKHLFTVRFSM